MRLKESKNQETLSIVGASELSGRSNQLNMADFIENHEQSGKSPSLYANFRDACNNLRT